MESYRKVFIEHLIDDYAIIRGDEPIILRMPEGRRHARYIVDLELKRLKLKAETFRISVI